MDIQWTGLLKTAGWFWLAAMNFIGFVTAGWDKRKARLNRWRTPEKRFLLLAALGGGAGVLLGFIAFRHKTRHTGLMGGVGALAAVWLVLLTVAQFA